MGKRRNKVVQEVETDGDGVPLRASPGVYAVGSNGVDHEMPRTRTVRTIIDEEQPVGGEAEIIEGGEEISPVDELLQELGGGSDLDIAVSRLDRTKPNGRVFCGSISAGGMNNSQILCTRIQQEFGGGDFFLQIKDPNTNRFSKRILISVEAPKNVVQPVQQVQESVAAAIRASNEAMLGAVREMLAARGQGFSIASLAKDALNFLPLIQAAQSLGLLGGRRNDGFDFEKFLEYKMKMEAAGLGDGEPNTLGQVMSFAREFGKPLVELAQKQASLQAGPGPQAAHAPAMMRPAAPGTMPAPPSGVVPGTAFPGVVPAPMQPTGKASSTALPIAQMVAPLIPMLVQAAQSGTDPSIVAQQIAEVLPDEAVDPVCDAIESGELVTVLARTRELAGYGMWLSQLGQILLSMLDGDEEPEGEEVAGIRGIEQEAQRELDESESENT